MSVHSYGVSFNHCVASTCYLCNYMTVCSGWEDWPVTVTVYSMLQAVGQFYHHGGLDSAFTTTGWRHRSNVCAATA